MEESVFRILDGSAIRDVLGGQFSAIATRRFQKLAAMDADADDAAAHVKASDVRAAAEEEAAALLLGSELCGRQIVVQTAATSLPQVPAAAADTRLDAEAFEATLRDYLQAAADALQEEPMVVAVLDGTVIRGLLEDEDEFAMAAENVFDGLDTDNSGKINRSELRPAVQQLVTALGFPAPSAKPEVDDVVNKLLDKYAGKEDEELGQTQFAKLLQDVLQELADSLATQPIVYVRNVKVLDGTNLRKVLEDDTTLSDMAETTFKDLDKNRDGKLSRSEIRPIFESKAVQFGLPPFEGSMEDLYTEVFKAVDADDSGHVDKQEFQVLMRALLESFAMQLKLNPILVDVETAAQFDTPAQQ